MAQNHYWDNIFYTKRQINSLGYSKQRENDITRAFISILKACDYKNIKKFLRFFGIENTGRIDAVKFLLQKENTPDMDVINNKSIQKLLLGISPKTIKLTDDLTGYERDKQLPDAWIYNYRFVILIENKIRGNLDSGQMWNYQNNYNFKKKEIQCITWGDMYIFINKILVKNQTKKKQRDLTKDEYLLKEFLNILEWEGLKPFDGFCQDEFDVFNIKNINKLIKKGREIVIPKLKSVNIILEPIIKELVSENIKGHLCKFGTAYTNPNTIWIIYSEEKDEKYLYPQFSLGIENDRIYFKIYLKEKKGKRKGEKTHYIKFLKMLEEQGYRKFYNRLKKAPKSYNLGFDVNDYEIKTDINSIAELKEIMEKEVKIKKNGCIEIVRYFKKKWFNKENNSKFFTLVENDLKDLRDIYYFMMEL